VLTSADKPLFQFTPAPGIDVATQPDWAVSCTTPVGFQPDCPQAPTIVTVGGVPSYGWNWSTNASQNALRVGDTWTAQFDVVATGPPNVALPIDACTLGACRYSGAGPRDGMYTWANYLLNHTVTGGATVDVIQSFPLVDLTIQAPASASPLPPPPSPAPLVPPAPPIPVLSALPIAQPAVVGLSLPATVAQFQALSAGFLAAGFTRVGMKNRPIAQSVAALSPNAPKKEASRSRFE